MRYDADLDHNYRGTTVNAKFQRNSRDGWILGVCAGMADYTGWPLLWIRIAAIIALFVFNGFAVLGYLIAAYLMPVDVNRIVPRTMRRRHDSQYHY